MPRLYGRLSDLNDVSQEVTWKLVDSLFRQNWSLLIGGITFTLLGVIGLFGTGSFWYLDASAAFVTICIGRAFLSHSYARRRDSASPIIWARRSLYGGWLSAACWGVWAARALVFESEKSLIVMVIGVQSAALMASAVRNCAVRAVAESQIYIMLTPVFFACMASGNNYFLMFDLLVPFNAIVALSTAKFMHGQTLQLLLLNEEKSDLVAGLETARLELESVNAHLEGLVLTDALTGVANRRAFDFATAREWRRSLRENTTLSLLFLDVDHFKSYNDFYGHQAGDLCLQEVAATIGSVVRRPGDFLARYGGEEFAVILPQTDLIAASEIGESIIKAFTQLAMPHDTDSSYGHVSVSIGAAALAAAPGTTVEDLTALADGALYAAKGNGRNCVCVAETPAHLAENAVAGAGAGQAPALRA